LTPRRFTDAESLHHRSVDDHVRLSTSTASSRRSPIVDAVEKRLVE